MSTKQTVIFSFMVLFLAGMLFGLGAWFHFDSELDVKKKRVEMLTEQRRVLDLAVTGTSNHPGLRDTVENVSTGLNKQLEEATKRAEAMGNETDGAKSLEARYEATGKQLPPKFEDAGAKWKALYVDWRKLNGDIDQALVKLKEKQVKRDQEIAKARADRDTEDATELTETKKIVVERKGMQDEITKIRASNEETQDKISSVTRATRKTGAVTPQGKILTADETLHTAVVDIGSNQGVRQGMQFDVYSGAHAGLVKKGLLEIVKVGATSSQCVLLPPKVPLMIDSATNWVPTDPRMKYSPFAAGGADETEALELTKPKTREDRIEAYRKEKTEKEQGIDSGSAFSEEKNTAPPMELGKGFVPITTGDWIANQDFVPIVPAGVYQRQTVDELLSMADVNVSPLTFYFTDSVKTYRKEYLRRLAERNHCKSSDSMSGDVDYVVTAAGSTDIGQMQTKMASLKGKDEASLSGDMKAQSKTLQALIDGKKIGAHVIAEDEMEAFFTRRQRKTELLRANNVQPGQHTFYIVGETKERSTEQLKRYIQDHGGVMGQELDANIDYVVVGSGVAPEQLEKIKRQGLRIIREDELPRFFGAE